MCHEELSGHSTARTCYVLPRRLCEVTPVTRVKTQPRERGGGEYFAENADKKAGKLQFKFPEIICID